MIEGMFGIDHTAHGVGCELLGNPGSPDEFQEPYGVVGTVDHGPCGFRLQQVNHGLTALPKNDGKDRLLVHLPSVHPAVPFLELDLPHGLGCHTVIFCHVVSGRWDVSGGW